MLNSQKVERPKGHCIQVAAYMDHDGTIYYSPMYSLCYYEHCITLTRELVKIYSEAHNMEIAVCPDCLEKVRRLNENMIKLDDGF